MKLIRILLIRLTVNLTNCWYSGSSRKSLDVAKPVFKTVTIRNFGHLQDETLLVLDFVEIEGHLVG